MLAGKGRYDSKTVPTRTYWRNNSTDQIAYIFGTFKDRYRTMNIIGVVAFFVHNGNGIAPDMKYTTVNEFINHFSYIGYSVNDAT